MIELLLLIFFIIALLILAVMERKSHSVCKKVQEHESYVIPVSEAYELNKKLSILNSKLNSQSKVFDLYKNNSLKITH